MSAPTMRQVLPKEFIPPLKVLGKYDWLRWEPISSDPPTTGYSLNLPEIQTILNDRRIGQMLHLCSCDVSHLLHFYVYSKALAGGPKLLRPTTEQCEALEQVDVNVSFPDYEQPFPVFIVEFPSDFRQQLAQRFGRDCPRFAVTLHDRPSQYIFCMTEYVLGKWLTFNIMSSRPHWGTVEDALRLNADEGSDIELGRVLQRIAINFGLLLTRYGAKDLGPADPVAFETLRNHSQRRCEWKANKAKNMLAATMNLIEFEQDVVFFEKARPGETSLDADGSMKRPHWRRGHFRKQPFGKGHSQRKLVFVRPCFINAGFFHGELSDTSYQIQSV